MKNLEVIPSVLRRDLSRDFDWRVLFPIVLGRLSDVHIDNLCTEVRLPSLDIKSHSIQMGVLNLKSLGHLSVGNLGCSFIETSDYIVSKYLNDWFGLGFSNLGFFRRGSVYSKYKKDIYLVLKRYKDFKGSKFIIGFYGCFPLKVPFVSNLHVRGEDVLRVSVDFSCDYIEVRSD